MQISCELDATVYELSNWIEECQRGKRMLFMSEVRSKVKYNQWKKEVR